MRHAGALALAMLFAGCAAEPPIDAPQAQFIITKPIQRWCVVNCRIIIEVTHSQGAPATAGAITIEEAGKAKATEVKKP